MAKFVWCLATKATHFKGTLPSESQTGTHLGPQLKRVLGWDVHA